MVRDLWQTMGDIGVEVLPYVPVVYKGIDAVGGELLAGVKNWIEWMAEQQDRRSVSELAKTAGEEVGWRECSRVIYRPCSVVMTNREKGKEGEERSWSNRGNRVEYVKGERREVELRCMQRQGRLEECWRRKE